MRNGTLTASATNADSSFSVDNIIDWRSYTLWKSTSIQDVTIEIDIGSAKAADCIGIFNHNLKTAGALIKVQYYDGSWKDAYQFVASNDKTQLKVFDSKSGTKWRVAISSLGRVPYIGIIYIGSKLEFQWPPVSPVSPVEESMELEGEYSRAGNFLGALLTYNPIRISQRFTLVTRNWYDANFKPFWRNHGKLLRPFFYAVDLENNADDVYWLQFDPGYVRRNPFSLLTYYDEFTLDLMGVSEE